MRHFLVPLAAIPLLLVPACRPASDAAVPVASAPAGTDQVAAEVNGEPVTLSELDEWIKEDLFRIRAGEPNELFELRNRALQLMLEERVLELEAQHHMAVVGDFVGRDPDRDPYPYKK